MPTNGMLVAEAESSVRLFISTSTLTDYVPNIASIAASKSTGSHSKRRKITTDADDTQFRCGRFCPNPDDLQLHMISYEHRINMIAGSVSAHTMTVCKDNKQQYRNSKNVCMQYHNRFSGWMKLMMEDEVYTQVLEKCSNDITERGISPFISEKHSPECFPFYIMINIPGTSNKLDISRMIAEGLNRCLTGIDFKPVSAYCFETITNVKRRTLRIHWPDLCVTHDTAVYLHRYIIFYIRTKHPPDVVSVHTDWASQYTSFLPIITTTSDIASCTFCANQSAKRDTCNTCLRTGITMKDIQYAPMCVINTEHDECAENMKRTLDITIDFANVPQTTLTKLLRMLSVRNVSTVSTQPVLFANMLFKIPVLPYVLSVQCQECTHVGLQSNRCYECSSTKVKHDAEFLHSRFQKNLKCSNSENKGVVLRSATINRKDATKYVKRIVDGRFDHICKVVKQYLGILYEAFMKDPMSNMSGASSYMYKHFDRMFHLVNDPTKGCDVWRYCMVSDVYMHVNKSKDSDESKFVAILDGLGSCYCPFSGETHPDTPMIVEIKAKSCRLVCGCKSGRTHPVHSAYKVKANAIDELAIYESYLFREARGNVGCVSQKLSLTQAKNEECVDAWIKNRTAEFCVFPGMKARLKS